MRNEAQTLLLLLLLLATLASVAAHPSPSLPSHPSCTSSPRPTAYSFHVHVTFDDAAGSSSRREALALRTAFAAKFGISAAPINPATCDDTNTVRMALSLCLLSACLSLSLSYSLSYSLCFSVSVVSGSCSFSLQDHSHSRVFNANEFVTYQCRGPARRCESRCCLLTSTSSSPHHHHLTDPRRKPAPVPHRRRLGPNGSRHRSLRLPRLPL